MPQPVAEFGAWCLRVALVLIAFLIRAHGFEPSPSTDERTVKFEVSCPVATSFDESIIAEIRKMPDVQAVAPCIRRVTMLQAGGKKYKTMLLGVGLTHDFDVGDFTLKDGKLSDKQEGALLEAGFADAEGIKINDEFTFMTRRGYVRTKVIGLFEYSRAARVGETSKMIIPLVAAQELCLVKGKVDFATVILKSGSDPRATRAAIEKVLPKGVSVFEVVERRASDPNAVEPASSAASKK